MRWAGSRRRTGEGGPFRGSASSAGPRGATPPSACATSSTGTCASAATWSARAPLRSRSRSFHAEAYSNKTPSRFWVEALSERAPFDLRRLFELAERAQSAKKLLLLALVDEESDLTYYRVRRTHPHGALPARPLATPTEGILAHDRILLFEPQAVEELGRALAYGSRVGHRLELSLLEGSYLLGTGQIELQEGSTGRTIPAEQFARRVLRLDPDFTERKAAYRDLRGRGLVVKTGFKYGAHFRAYPRSPDHSHARYLIHAVPDSHVAAWPAIAGAIRVAQGVRKEYLLAGVRPEGTVRYLSLERIRP